MLQLWLICCWHFWLSVWAIKNFFSQIYSNDRHISFCQINKLVWYSMFCLQELRGNIRVYCRARPVLAFDDILQQTESVRRWCLISTCNRLILAIVNLYLTDSIMKDVHHLRSFFNLHLLVDVVVKSNITVKHKHFDFCNASVYGSTQLHKMVL